MATRYRQPASRSTQEKLARLFDIRSIVAALVGIFGVVLVLAGTVPDAMGVSSHRPSDANTVDLEAGVRANLWVGLILIAIAVIFAVWAYVRPLKATASDEAAPPEVDEQ